MDGPAGAADAAADGPAGAADAAGGGAGAPAPAGPWLRPERSGRGPDPGYSRDQITRAAVALADGSGLAAVSMRRVAEAVGTAPASLYRYLRTRDELLTLMADAVAGEVVLPDRPTGDWLADLLALARRQLASHLRHPWLLDVGPGPARMGPNAVAFLECALACMAGLDVPAGAKLEAVAMATGVVTLFARDALAGDAAQSTAAAQRDTVAFIAKVVADGRHPHLAAALAAPDPTAADPGTRFDRVLTGVLRGLLDPAGEAGGAPAVPPAGAEGRSAPGRAVPPTVSADVRAAPPERRRAPGTVANFDR